MRRFLTITLLFALYLLFSVDRVQGECAIAYVQEQTLLSEAPDKANGDLEMSREWGSDMLRPSGCRTLSQSEVSQNHSVQHHLRQRNSSEHKTVPHLVPCRHLGHVTHIFDYDNFRSSLGNGYYLHSLCRLRI